MDRHRQDVARRCFFGIDKEIDLVAIAKAYMAIAGDGRGGIAQENALHPAARFQGQAKNLFTTGDGAFKQFDVIFTNPPFGSRSKVLKDEAAQFVLGRNQKGESRDTEPQILFVERCLQMLKDGGVLAIVLPESFFHAPSYRRALRLGEVCPPGN